MQRSRELPVRWRFQIEKKSRSESSACRLRIAWGSSPCGFMSPIAPAACRWSVWLSPNQGPSLRAFEGGGGATLTARGRVLNTREPLGASCAHLASCCSSRIR